MLAKMVSLIFGCSHGRTTFPLTPRADRSTPAHATYVTCLDCGKEFKYDWDAMRMERIPLRQDRHVNASTTIIRFFNLSK